MHLDAGGDPEGGDSVFDGGKNIPGRTVSAREEQQIDLQGFHVLCRLPRIFGRGRCFPEGAYHFRCETAGQGLFFPHVMGTGDEFDLIPYGDDPFQGKDGPRGRLGFGPEGPGFFQDFAAVASLEPDTTAHPGDGVDDETEFFHDVVWGGKNCLSQSAQRTQRWHFLLIIAYQ